MASNIDSTWTTRLKNLINPPPWTKYTNDPVPERSRSPLEVSKYGDLSAKDQARQHNGNVYNNNVLIYNITYNRSTLSVGTIQEDQDEFFEAAANGHTRRVLRLIGKPGVKLDKSDVNGMTALHHACLSGFEDTVRAILEAGARINIRSPIYGTPLCLAVLKEREDLVHYLLDQRADPNGPGGQLGSALHAACHVGNFSLVKALIGADARVDLTRIIRWQRVSELRNPESVNKYDALTEGQPLIVAAREGSNSIVNMLLDCGADVNGTHREWYSHDFAWETYDEADPDSRSCGQTAIFEASDQGHAAVVETLIRRGAQVDVVYHPRGYTPMVQAITHGRIESAAILIHHGADISHCDAAGLAAIHYAITIDSPNCIDLLITSGGNANMQATSLGWTPLIMAATLGNMASIRSLLDHKAPINSQDIKGYTACMRSVVGRHSDCLKILAEAGADLDRQSSENAGRTTAVILAAQMGNLECLSILLDHKANLNLQDFNGRAAIHLAVLAGSVEAVRLTAEAKANLNIQDNDGRTALIHAVATEGIEHARVLLSHGARKDISEPDEYSVAHYAALKPDGSFMELLLQDEPEVIIQAVSLVTRMTPLHIAAGAGNVEVIKILIRHGALVEISNAEGLTPAGSAAYHNQMGAMEILLDLGASMSPSSTSVENWPLPQAAQGGHLGLFKWLLQFQPSDTKDAAVDAAIELAGRYGKMAILKVIEEFFSQR